VSRRTKTRRRFQTDRIVRTRRERAYTETPGSFDHAPERLAYGRLAQSDPWDCGKPACGFCNPRDLGRRAREQLQWRVDWKL
jgi:hypothetical protein